MPEKLSEDPFSGCVFIFRSRSGTSIRLLCYDGQGYYLAQKRLSKGRFTWWPESASAAKQLEAYEAQLLMVTSSSMRRTGCSSGPARSRTPLRHVHSGSAPQSTPATSSKSPPCAASCSKSDASLRDTTPPNFRAMAVEWAHNLAPAHVMPGGAKVLRCCGNRRRKRTAFSLAEATCSG